MGSVIMPSPGVSALEQTVSSARSAPKVREAIQNAFSGDVAHLSHEALQLQEANGLLRSALDPGAPNIQPNNTLEAIDALLLGFTPTSSVVPSPPVGGSASTGALFGVGTAAGLANPTVNLLA
jgi:hypothetical protein